MCCNSVLSSRLIIHLADSAWSRSGLFGAYDVAYAEGVTACRFEMYCERITAADNIVFQCVLYQQLYTDGYDVMVYQVMVDVVLEAQILAVAYGHHLAVGLGELQLLLECHEALALHYVAVGRGELLQVLLRLVVVGAYQSAKGVERVEEEVRVELVFEGLVAHNQVLVLQFFFFEIGLLLTGEIIEYQ